MKQHASNWLTKTWAVALVAFLCSALWGSAFSGVKIGYTLLKIEASDWASQLVFAGARFFLAGCMAFLMGSAAQRKLLLPSVQAMPKILIISCFQTILQYLFYYIGLAHTTGVNAAIIVAANVFAAILIASLLFRIEKLTAAKVIGCIIGFSGILLVHCSGLQGGMHLNLLGDGFIFLCTIASGFSSVFMKKYSAQENPVLLSSWQFCLGGLVMGGWFAVRRKHPACHAGSVGHFAVSGVCFGSCLLYVGFAAQVQSGFEGNRIWLLESHLRCCALRYFSKGNQFFWYSGDAGIGFGLCWHLYCKSLSGIVDLIHRGEAVCFPYIERFPLQSLASVQTTAK